MKIGEAKEWIFMGFSPNSFHATSAKLQLQEADYQNTNRRNRYYELIRFFYLENLSFLDKSKVKKTLVF